MTGMRLARRSRKRGALDKALGLARARAARLASSPPLPPRAPADPHAAARVRSGAGPVLVVSCDASEGRGYEALEEARAAAPHVLLLALDLFVDEAQIRRARQAGADGVVLVARVLPQDRLAELAAAARAQGLSVSVEVRSAPELAGALAIQADAVRVAEMDRDNGRPDPDAAATRAAAEKAHVAIVDTASKAADKDAP
ncbi:MAG: hypothetical protein JNL21_03585 [Myxococcales bacterium]|nr:hypothetical protein [Myxococcales bacterium]